MFSKGGGGEEGRKKGWKGETGLEGLSEGIIN